MPGRLLLEDAGLAQGQETRAWLTTRSGIAGQDDPRCLVCIRTVSHRIAVGETLKRVTVASLDGVEPCLLDRKAKACMGESNESSHAGKVEALGIKCSIGGLGC